MAISNGPADQSPSESSKPPPPQRSLWERYGVTALLLLLLAGLILVEGYGYSGQRKSVERVKQWTKTLPPDDRIHVNQLEGQLTGSPRRKAFEHEGSLRMIYTWPSIAGTYRMRAQIRVDGQVIYVDTEPNEAEDFMTPFLVSNNDGVRLVGPQEQQISHAPAELKLDLQQEVQAQFSQLKPQAAEAFVIFPFTDDGGAITPAGPALSMIAQHSLVFTPARKVNINPGIVQQALLDNDCWAPGTVLDQPRIDACLKDTGAKAYVLPRLNEREGKWVVRMNIFESGMTDPVTIERSAAALNLVPGELTLGLFEHLNIAVTPKEVSDTTAPQFQGTEDMEALVRLVRREPLTSDQSHEFYQQVVEKNVQCIAAWRYYLAQSQVRELPTLPHLCEHPALAVGQIRRMQSKVGIARLLKAAPQLRGDAEFYATLVNMAWNLKEEKLAEELFRIWTSEDASYASHVARARIMSGRGWAALPHYATSPPTPAEQKQSHELFRQAQGYLKNALFFNPDGIDALTEMVQVGLGLDLPWPELQVLMEDALRVRPGNQQAWDFVLNRVAGRLGPANASNAYQFADFCLNHGKWNHVPDILRGAAYDFNKRAVDVQLYQTPEHWRLIERYFQIAQQEKLDATQLRLAQACFAHDAAVTGHYAEAAPVFELLDIPFVPPPAPVNSPASFAATSAAPQDPILYRFEGKNRYVELRDLVRAKMRTAAVDGLSAARIALIESRLADAEAALSKSTPANDGERLESERLRRAIAFALRLKKERRINLTAQEAFELFAEIDQQTYRGINGQSDWKVQDGKLVARFDGHRRNPADPLQTAIYFPVGLRHGTISGQLTHEGGILTVSLIAHAQAVRQPVSVSYSFTERGKVLLIGNGAHFEENLSVNPTTFKIQYGEKSDIFSPYPQYQWTVPVTDDSPSTFGLRVVWSEKNPGAVSFSNLVIESADQ